MKIQVWTLKQGSTFKRKKGKFNENAAYNFRDKVAHHKSDDVNLIFFQLKIHLNGLHTPQNEAWLEANKDFAKEFNECGLDFTDSGISWINEAIISR